MREPVIDLILLSLVVLFFGLEQRRRPQHYFRFWLAGWVLVLVSVLCRTLTAEGGRGSELLRCIREDTIACGALAFVFSFLVSKRRWVPALQCAVAIALPVCLALDLIVVHRAPMGLINGLVLLGEGLCLFTAYRFLRKGQTWFLPLITAVCVCSGLTMGYAAAEGRLDDLYSLMLGQGFVCAGLLFARSGLKGGRLVGGIAFMVWGVFCALRAEMFAMTWLSGAIQNVRLIPKYLVGAGMVLTIFEEAQAEIACLGVQHRRLYEEYRVLFMSNPHSMWIYDPETTRVLAVNDAAVAAYGFSEEEFLGMPMGCIEAEEECTSMCDEHQSVKRGERHKRADGSVIDVEVTTRDVMFGEREARFLMAVDITERETLHRELVRRAQHDVLTGLPNRSILDDRIEQCLSRCIREETKGALLTIDIDHFKRVNDTFGHLTGDECLKAVAGRLSSRVRQVDTIARTGGEEFTIVVGGLGNSAAAEKVCSGMLSLFDTPMRCGEHELMVTVSIGVALFPDHAIDIEGLLRRSDQALYEAKRLGRNRAVFASTVVV